LVSNVADVGLKPIVKRLSFCNLICSLLVIFSEKEKSKKVAKNSKNIDWEVLMTFFS